MSSSFQNQTKTKTDSTTKLKIDLNNKYMFFPKSTISLQKNNSFAYSSTTKSEDERTQANTPENNYLSQFKEAYIFEPKSQTQTEIKNTCINYGYSHGKQFDADEYSGISYINTNNGGNTNEGIEDYAGYYIKKKSFENEFKLKYKTEKCKYWELKKECKFGESCAFAHGDEDIRDRIISSTNYKTKKCKQFFDAGYCPYGSRCQFLHGQRSYHSNNKKNNRLNIYSPKNLFSFNKIFNFLDSSETALSKRSRLKTFQNLTLDIKSELNESENINNHVDNDCQIKARSLTV